MVNQAYGHDCGACKIRPMDISFVVDASSSVKPTGFNLAKEFIIQLLDHFVIAQNRIRASVITYSGQSQDPTSPDYQEGSIDKEHAIHYSESINNAALKKAIREIPYTKRTYTNTSAGIEYALDYQVSEARKVKRTLVVITDGKSQDAAITLSEGKRAQDMGLSVFAVGVGSDVDMQELRGIAGDFSRVFNADSYELLSKEIHEALTDAICMPPSNLVKCRDYPVDLMFIIDTSSSINAHCQCDAYREGLEFIASALDLVEIDDGTTRVAAVQYARGVRPKESIPFGKYKTRKAMKDAILNLKYVFEDNLRFGGGTKTGQGIDYARTKFLRNTRADAAKVMIVVTDGRSNYGRASSPASSTKITIAAANRARKAGASIIGVGVGLDESIQEEELVKIADSRKQMVNVREYDQLKNIIEVLNSEYCNAAEHSFSKSKK